MALSASLKCAKMAYLLVVEQKIDRGSAHIDRGRRRSVSRGDRKAREIARAGNSYIFVG